MNLKDLYLIKLHSLINWWGKHVYFSSTFHRHSFSRATYITLYTTGNIFYPYASFFLFFLQAVLGNNLLYPPSRLFWQPSGATNYAFHASQYRCFPLAGRCVTERSLKLLNLTKKPNKKTTAILPSPASDYWVKPYVYGCRALAAPLLINLSFSPPVRTQAETNTQTCWLCCRETAVCWFSSFLQLRLTFWLIAYILGPLLTFRGKFWKK